LYLPGGRSISGLSGALRPAAGASVKLIPARAANLMVCSLMVTTASSSVSLPSISLTLPRPRQDAGIRGGGLAQRKVGDRPVVLMNEPEQRRSIGGRERDHRWTGSTTAPSFSVQLPLLSSAR